jgi:flagellar biogenesis protein FliO
LIVNNFLDRLPIDPRLKKILPYIISLFLLIAVLVGAFISSQVNTPPAAATQTDGLGLLTPTSSFDITLDAVLKIIFVFGLIYMFFALLRWVQKKQPGQVQNRLRIIETVRPSPRQTFYLLKVGSQEFLVGATDQSMSLISEVEPDMLAELQEPQPVEEKQNGSSGFNAILQNSMKQTLNLFQKNTNEEIRSDPQQQVVK